VSRQPFFEGVGYPPVPQHPLATKLVEYYLVVE